MLRDNLMGLIEPMIDNAGAQASVGSPQPKNGGMLQVERVGKRRSEAILTPNFCWKRATRPKKEIADFSSNTDGLWLSCCSQRASTNGHRTIDPQCLENPRPEGAESTPMENAASPFPAEPGQSERTELYSEASRNTSSN